MRVRSPRSKHSTTAMRTCCVSCRVGPSSRPNRRRPTPTRLLATGNPRSCSSLRLRPTRPEADVPGLHHVTRKQKLLTKAGFDVALLNLGMSSRLAPFVRLREVLNQTRGSVVYSRLSKRTLASIIMLGLARRPVVLEINGLTDQFLPRAMRPGLRWTLRRIVARGSFAIVGDRSWQQYACELLGQAGNYIELPLTPGVERIASAEPDQTVVFAGTLSAYQGVDQLIDAWNLIADAAWTLKIVGEGPERGALEAQAAGAENIVFLPLLEGQDYHRELARAGVLVGHYPGKGLATYRRSMLKTMDYAVTDRPFVTNRLDTLLDDLDGPADGAFVWDLDTAETLAETIRQAMHAATRGDRFPDRADLIDRLRGAPVQIERLTAAVDRALARS